MEVRFEGSRRYPLLRGVHGWSVSGAPSELEERAGCPLQSTLLSSEHVQEPGRCFSWLWLVTVQGMQGVSSRYLFPSSRMGWPRAPSSGVALTRAFSETWDVVFNFSGPCFSFGASYANSCHRNMVRNERINLKLSNPIS